MNRNRGFTLIELLIVVAIIGLLTAIAYYNIQGYRLKAQKYVCIANLRELSNFTALWAINEGKDETSPVTMSDLVPAYIKATPYCPLDRDKEGYILKSVSEGPKCPKDPATHNLDFD